LASIRRPLWCMPRSGAMTDPTPSPNTAAGLRERHADRALTLLRAASPRHAELLQQADLAGRVARVGVASDFAIETLRRQPALLEPLSAYEPVPLPLPVLDPLQTSEWAGVLRRYRAAASTRLVWRDVLGLDDVDAILAGSTELAEQCLAIALEALER